MLIRLITWSLAHRGLVLLGAAGVVLAGLISVTRMNFDAFPDSTPVQVQINTMTSGLVPEEVERLITFPVELALSGLPRLEQVRSISQFGLSQVVVTFEDGTDIYFARNLIAQRLSTVQMPEGVDPPEMGPIATGLGEVFHYLLSSKNKDLTELRTIHDWVVKPVMRQVRGNAEINSWGGLEKQYQVRIDPVRLIKYDLTFDAVTRAVTDNNLNVGGGHINRNQSGEMLLVHGIGRTTNTAQIENIVITSKDGVPIRVRDVAQVTIGHEIRRGMVSANGQGEVVLGLGFMLMGENSYAVTRRMKQQMQHARSLVPPDVDIDVVYDRTELVDHVIETVRHNLFDAALLVVVVLFVIMGNLRAGLIVATAIPLSMFFAFSGMWRAGIAGTLLSLGAIDFGVVVESNVVMIENMIRRIARPLDASKTFIETIRAAAIEVRQPAVFGQLIIMIVYLPLLTLEGVEGKMFRPMAWTLIFLLSGSLLSSLTVIPVLASFLLPRRIEETEPLVVRAAKWLYRPIVEATARQPRFALALGALALLGGGKLALSLGSEFVPRLSEGAIVIGIAREAGTDIVESERVNGNMEKALLAAFPDEIDRVWSRTGAPEVATDPSTVEMVDMFITLRPRESWKKAHRQDELVRLMEREVADIPGQTIWFTQPIEQRINEMVSGVRSDIAVKLFGEDFPTLLAKAREIEDALRAVPGVADLVTEQIAGQPILQVRVRQEEIARYGIPARNVLDLIESVGSKPLGVVIEGQLRFPMAVRLPEHYRGNPKAIASLMVAAPSGEQIPLSRLADVEVVSGPRMIPREWSQRRITVMCNVRGRDIGSFVAAAQKEIADKVQLPDGYRVEWGGQFENMRRAQGRLAIVVPVALALIVALLYATYRNATDTAFVFLSVPFAAVGGLVGLWLRDLPISISAAVGFITLAGVSVLNSMVMVSAIRLLQSQGTPNPEAITAAALERLRTIMMTAMVGVLGFLPMAISQGVGAEVQRPLASVVIGGVISSTIMTLIVLPALYLLVPPVPKGTAVGGH